MDVNIQIKLPLNASTLDQENAIQAAVNQAGLLSTRLLLEGLNVDGRPLQLSDAEGRIMRMSAKKKPVIKEIQTPYGALSLPRFVYQSSAGGACLVPLDRAAGLIGSATPKFAQMVSSKIAEMPARAVARDLAHNHQRSVCLEQLQNITGRVGDLARAMQPHLPLEEAELPPADKVATVTLGVDAASMLMNTLSDDSAKDRRKSRQLDWRMGMVGTISFYDTEGERLHTQYLAQAPPEVLSEGKTAFWKQMDAQVKRIKDLYPKARYTGVSDGAPDLAAWLVQHTDEPPVLDYYHAAAYLDLAAPAFYTKPEEASAWAAVAREDLREVEGAAGTLLAEMVGRRDKGRRRLSPQVREGLDKAIGYIQARVERMDYARLRAAGIPIGSGVTESACKLLIKHRMCGPGMRWGHRAADHVLTLRSMLYSDGMWRVLWSKLSPKNPALSDV